MHKQYIGKIFCFIKVEHIPWSLFQSQHSGLGFLFFNLAQAFFYLIKGCCCVPQVFFLLEANSCPDVSCGTKADRCRLFWLNIFHPKRCIRPSADNVMPWVCTAMSRHGDLFLILKTCGNTLCDRHKWRCFHI